MENLHNQQEQAEKKMPYSVERLMNQRYESRDLFYSFSHTVMTEGLDSDAVSKRFRKDEEPIDDILIDFCEWQGILYNSQKYDALLDIIFEYKLIAFRAGFKAAQELLR